MVPDRVRTTDLAEVIRKVLSRPMEPGEIGVVLARAGVGKSAFLVQLALGEVLSGGSVVHIALNKPLGQVEAHYEALYSLGRARWKADVSDSEMQASDWRRRRVIQVFADGTLTPERFRYALDTVQKNLSLNPNLVVVDGSLWSSVADDDLQPYRDIARQAKTRLWLLARTQADDITDLPKSLQVHRKAIDVAVLLSPEADQVRLRPVWAYSEPVRDAQPIALSADSLQPVPTGDAGPADGLSPAACTLFSGGVAGAESTFGECAERWGVAECNFTFAGHQTTRSRGLVVLDQEDLEKGDVSWAYLSSHLDRKCPQTDGFRRILQSIWHQVNPAGQVFSVGELLPNETVKGGTGWSVELAKHLGKPVCVFDQVLESWFQWTGDRWQPAAAPPTVQHPRFAGGGTRSLNSAGKSAIQQLFERSFG